MITNMVICDRCHKDCGEKTYYTININAHDVNPTNDGRCCLNTLAHNLSEKCKWIFGPDRHYCKECIEEFEKFMKDNTEDCKDVYDGYMGLG